MTYLVRLDRLISQRTSSEAVIEHTRILHHLLVSPLLFDLVEQASVLEGSVIIADKELMMSFVSVYVVSV